MPRLASAPIAAFAFAALALAASASPASAFEVALVEVVRGLDEPLYVGHAGDGSGRIFVCEHAGAIRIVKDGKLVERPFLDLSDDGLDRVSRPKDIADERGLLGLAFHPDYEKNGRFFVHYTRVETDESIVAEYKVSAGDPDRADETEKIVLGPIDQPQWNHNGGMIEFGPDGMLYVALGDGGMRADFGPGHTEGKGNAQDTTNLLGSILRIDVDKPQPPLAYGIPEDNPFAKSDGPDRKEIWAWGLRNPWRFSFDRGTGRLFCADVGQDKWEEINIVEAGNYGWRLMEGYACFNPEKDCQTPDLKLPIHVYNHDVEGGGGLSVTGGYVYRGKRFPAFEGRYFYGDHASGRLWSLAEGSDGKWTATEHLRVAHYLPTFGEDQDGEIYTTNYFQGILLRIEEKK